MAKSLRILNETRSLRAMPRHATGISMIDDEVWRRQLVSTSGSQVQDDAIEPMPTPTHTPPVWLVPWRQPTLPPTDIPIQTVLDDTLPPLITPAPTPRVNTRTPSLLLPTTTAPTSIPLILTPVPTIETTRTPLATSVIPRGDVIAETLAPVSSKTPSTLTTLTKEPVAIKPSSSPNEQSTTTIAEDSHDSYTRLMVSLIVLGVVVIVLISIVGVYMELRRRKQRHQEAQAAYFYGEGGDPLDGFDEDDAENWDFDSHRTPQAYL